MNNSTANISGRLRNRLFYLLMAPLLFISSLFAIETYLYSQTIAKESFDKSLTVLSMVMMEQSANLSGDIVSDKILKSITDSIGDVFYYHVNTPENSLISGYTNGPKPSRNVYKMATEKPQLFNAKYRNRPTRAAFFRRHIDNVAYQGWVELTVWQHFDQQHELQARLFTRSLFRLVGLVFLVGAILWFGINFGLHPLTRLQAAVSRRSINDLHPIKTPIPLEVKQLVESMNDLFLRLKSSIAKREAFLANASHQLKTPLANIRGKAELAFDSEKHSSKQAYIKDLLSMTDQTSRLVNQMLSLLQAQGSDLLTTPYQQIELNQLVKSTCEYYAPYAVKDKRELIFEPCSPITISVRMPLLVTECLSNLIENAINYSHANKSIIISIEHQGDKAIINVTDSGPGIPQELHQEVAQRFYRVPGTKPSGYGLGLAIVKEILKNMNAELYFIGPSEDSFTVSIHMPILPTPYKSLSRSSND